MGREEEREAKEEKKEFTPKGVYECLSGVKKGIESITEACGSNNPGWIAAPGVVELDVVREIGSRLESDYEKLAKNAAERYVSVSSDMIQLRDLLPSYRVAPVLERDEDYTTAADEAIEAVNDYIKIDKEISEKVMAVRNKIAKMIFHTRVIEYELSKRK